MNKRIIIIVISSLLVGFAAGVFSMQIMTRKRIHDIIEMQRPPKFRDDLKEQLKLTPEQAEKFDNIFKEHIQQVRGIREGEREALKNAMDGLYNDLAKELNEDQVKILRDFEMRMRRNHQKKMQRDREYHRPE
ncbi:MAG: hypothetical protein GC181_13295 [Bacteroidetes bacterium]|nr:hypothetical protein [Bacteroidota bacterium]